MGIYVEYVNIHINSNADVDEIEDHLSKNGYDFGIDRKRNLLFANLEEVPYVATILADRGIEYKIDNHLF